MPTFSSDQATISYQVWGSLTAANVVTLVNGYTRGLSDFRGMAKVLEANDICAISLDNRGSGATESHLPFSIEEMAGDVIRLWDEVGINRSSLLGISMGGLIAQLVAKRASARINRLILVSTSPYPTLISSDEVPWSRDQNSIEQKLARNFSQAFLDRNKLLVRSMAKNILESIDKNDFIRRAEGQRKAISSVKRDEFNFHSDIPTLVMHGTEDQVIPFSVTDAFATKFSNLTTLPFKGFGHLLIAESPAALYQAVVDFLKVELKTAHGCY